ncbi:EamA family transporter [Solimonas marina]|uniref:EamA/RhaT family transporter n=1 Tax=Solimonas marina TaxID=2714601 RepID=A0A970B878_9GAMM|nr:EamA/RhaT family transporter [Solimonas marina]NKF24455.1 EamA/RhaT family transporter [Solimonas marina]
MFNLVFAVVCSVLVSVLLKLAPRARLDVAQMVAVNYLVAAVCSAILLRPVATAPLPLPLPWLPLLALGVLLPTIFIVLGASVRHAGIVRSDVAQRLSLLVSLIAAFTVFGQTPTPRLLAGIAIGLLALIALVWRRDANTTMSPAAWALPLLVFVGFGAIDVLLKQLAAGGLPFGDLLLCVFATSWLVALLIVVVRRARGIPLAARSLAAGVLLGVLNFGNILFYLRAHRALADDPARVFTATNLGVVALGAVVGIVLFGERLPRFNLVGLALTVPAILLLASA